jgi:hypothetical protein
MMPDPLADLTGERTRELLSGLIRIGTVGEVLTDGRVRVTFADRDGVTSQPLAVLQRWSSGSLSMPVQGEQVLCLMLPPEQTDGFVFGALYAKDRPPPVADPTTRVLAADLLLLGGVQAGHPVPFGDVLLRILVGLREILASVQVATPAGPGSLTCATTSYGSGLVPAVAAAMASDVDDAVLNSQKVRVE